MCFQDSKKKYHPEIFPETNINNSIVWIEYYCPRCMSMLGDDLTKFKKIENCPKCHLSLDWNI